MDRGEGVATAARPESYHEQFQRWLDTGNALRQRLIAEIEQRAKQRCILDEEAHQAEEMLRHIDKLSASNQVPMPVMPEGYGIGQLGSLQQRR